MKQKPKELEWRKRLRKHAEELADNLMAYNGIRQCKVCGAEPEQQAEWVIGFIEKQRTELLEEILGVIDENKLQYPNLYGKYIQVKRYNEVLIPKIKSEVIRLLNKKDESK